MSAQLFAMLMMAPAILFLGILVAYPIRFWSTIPSSRSS